MTRIEWTDRTWNPILGCSKVSAGCRNCYAERWAHRLGARPRRNEWIRDIVEQCRSAGVACFVKKIVGPDGRACEPGPEWPREFPTGGVR